jgi:Xaa-Pro aminopeptidase
MEVDDRKLSRISVHELERRWKLVGDYMRERGIDALIAQNAKDFTGGYVRWFTDIPAGYPQTVVFHATDLMSIVEHGPEGAHRNACGNDVDHPGIGEIFTTASVPSVTFTQSRDADVVSGILRQRDYRRIGFIAPEAIPHGFIIAIEGAFADRGIISNETEFIDRVKAVKSAEEINLIKKTAEMQDVVFDRVLSQIKPGMRDSDVTATAQYEGQLLGSEQGIFLGSSSTMGERSSFAQRCFQGRTLRKNDYFPLLIENNGVGGYYCELARTIVLGKASQELIEATQAMKEAQEHTVRKLKPGASCKEIFLAHNKFMANKGLPAETRLYAHAQGYDLVERPIIRSDETLPLEKGMNIAVHPSYSTKSLYSVICGNYMVESDGPSACLHKTPSRIFELN